ncbi:flagellar protein FlaG [Hydrogenispora ethanolica]|uniref:Flagellar protein FlaG n=1 Tax=Hydrogenispora ethanolica TaxID=1082276 RepID=A0A4R1RWK3_HYDET|nr:flagellar protein FlaG [Hydrogenispora ethanolica]TCL70986.1 flagellar protein FlaG [Hydrogenispora ethanolica]
MRIQPVSDPNNQPSLAARMLPETPKPNHETGLQSNQPADAAVSQPADPKKIDKAVEVANQLMEEVDLSFKYYRDEATHIDVIQVVDDATGDVIKQFPPEDILKMVAKMYELWGIFVDEKA